MSMHTSVSGCKFCEIARSNKDLHLKESNKVVLVRDIKPKSSYHYLAISKDHINKPSDLTYADIPLLEEMEQVGREFLRCELKAKGQADTVEDMLRVGFHWGPLITVNHLHMHVVYPVKDLNLISRMLTFRPGKVFRETSAVIEELRKNSPLPDPLEGNPAKDDEPSELPAHAIAN